MFKFRTIVMVLMALCLVVTSMSDAEAARKKRARKAYANPATSGVNDPRYAALVMNPVTGEVYHQQDPDARRYPASLTKMMTLYMLFDALEKRKIDLDDSMSVSDLAARQAQTNLSLDAGDRIEVETAIKALVVRSANDVAVVVAEALGGDVDHFAEMMTAQAHKLGMKNTVFKNPNGLPDPEQRTTARDMAKLGIALKRDFPKYYRYFSTLQFSHAGVTYYTHNRVMLRYAGVDGIKTGYIGKSGFNLVTSVVRGGRPLVGVVMGGGTGAWRDNRMIQLLDQSYQTVASRGATRGRMFPANLPLSKDGMKKAAGVSEESDPNTPNVPIETAALPESGDTEDGEPPIETGAPVAAESASPFEHMNVPAELPAPVKVAQPSKSRVIKVTDAPAASSEMPPFVVGESVPAPATIVVPTTTVPEPEPVSLAKPPAKGDYGWGIQVGAFSSKALADQAVSGAMRTASRQLIGAKSAVAGPSGGSTVYRARIENISQAQAKRACETLISGHSPCFIYKAAP